MIVLECKALSKNYGDFCLQKINLELHGGKIVGLIGENGAGKTTLINLILDKINRDSGEVYICGQKYDRTNIKLKNHIGVILDECHLPYDFTVKNIDLCFKNIYNKWSSQLFYEYIDKFNIPYNLKIGSFSRGMKKKLELAIILAYDADIILLDEFTSGLDIVFRQYVSDLLKRIVKEKNKIVIVSTHNMDDIEDFVDTIIFIKRGKIQCLVSKDDIINKYLTGECDNRNLVLREVTLKDIIFMHIKGSNIENERSRN